MKVIGIIVVVLICIIVIYIAVGTGICWLLSSAGGEKMSLNGVSIRFILTWPLFLFRSKAI